MKQEWFENAVNHEMAHWEFVQREIDIQKTLQKPKQQLPDKQDINITINYKTALYVKTINNLQLNVI